MQSVPPVTQQMGTSLQAAAAMGNIEAWQQTIQYGYDLIDTMYRPHPIKRPFDLFRRASARREWEEQVRQTGVQLRAAMMQAALRGFTTVANDPIDEHIWTTAERRRREQTVFDIDQQIRLAKAQAKAAAKGELKVEEMKAALNKSPDPTAEIQQMMQMISEVENDPKLDIEQKRRRIDIIKLKYGQRGGS